MRKTINARADATTFSAAVAALANLDAYRPQAAPARRFNTLFDSQATWLAARAFARSPRQFALIDGVESWMTRQTTPAIWQSVDLINRLSTAGFGVSCVTSPAGQDTHFEYTISARA